MQDLSAVIAENLKNIRKMRNLSLDSLAAQTGVSKSMLGQIERQEVNPTISTIWKITKGLKINFSSLIETAQPEHEIITSATHIDTAEGKYHLFPLFAFSDQRNFEMHRILIEPGGFLNSEPHAPQTQEYIIVFSGELSLTYNDHHLTIGKGQAIRFNADVEHSYVNNSDVDTELSMMLFYKNE